MLFGPSSDLPFITYVQRSQRR